LGAAVALACGIVGLIVGVSDDLTWKLGSPGWFAGGTVAALLAIVMYIVMYMDHAATAKKQ